MQNKGLIKFFAILFALVIFTSFPSQLLPITLKAKRKRLPVVIQRKNWLIWIRLVERKCF